jgi:hypothetical protein
MLGQKTHHFHENWNWNQCNQGKEICRKNNETQELIGISTEKYTLIYIHQNSLREKSVIAVRTWKSDLTKNIRPWAAAGVATGYDKIEKIGSELTPAGYLGVDIHPDSDKFGLVVTWVPESFIGAGIRVRIK